MCVLVSPVRACALLYCIVPLCACARRFVLEATNSFVDRSLAADDDVSSSVALVTDLLAHPDRTALASALRRANDRARPLPRPPRADASPELPAPGGLAADRQGPTDGGRSAAATGEAAAAGAAAGAAAAASSVVCGITFAEVLIASLCTSRRSTARSEVAASKGLAPYVDLPP